MYIYREKVRDRCMFIGKEWKRERDVYRERVREMFIGKEWERCMFIGKEWEREMYIHRKEWEIDVCLLGKRERERCL